MTPFFTSILALMVSAQAVPAAAPAAPQDERANALPSIWSSRPKEGVAVLDLTDFLRESKEWIHADSARDPLLTEDLIFLLEAITPILLGYQRYENRAAYTRVAPLLHAERVEHPIASLAMGLTYPAAPWMGVSTHPFRLACQQLKASGAPPRLRLVANTLAAESEGEVVGPAGFRAYYDEAALALVDLVRQKAVASKGKPAPSTLQLRAVTQAAVKLVERAPVDVVERTIASMAAMEGLDQCLLETVTGAYETHVAWKERGGGYARTVGDKSGELFSKRLAKAYEHLHRAWTLDPSRPEAAVELIRVAMGGAAPSGETCRVWFERSLKADPTNEPAYQAMLWAARPRWGGSHEAMESLGLQALKSGRFESLVPEIYLTVLHELCDDGKGRAWLTRTDIGKRLDELEAGYGAAGIHAWDNSIKTWRYLAALERQDYEAAATLLADPNFVVQSYIMKVAGVDERDARGYAWTLSGPDAVRGRDALALIRRGEPAAAVAMFKALLDGAIARGDPNGRRDALEDSLACARMTAGWSGPDWFAPIVDARLHGWRLDSGSWCSTTAGEVEGGAVGEPVRLRTAVAPGQNFEAEVDLLVWQRPGKWIESGIQFCSNFDPASPGYFALIWLPNQDKLQLCALYGQKEAIALPFKPSKEAHLPAPYSAHIGIQVWNEWIVVVADGQELYAGPLPKHGWKAGDAFAMGTYHGARESNMTGFRDLKIRRIQAMPERIRAAQKEAKP